MNGRRVTRIAACGAALALLFSAWYFLAPAELGGRTPYVTTYGNNMEPLLHAGDLAIVRRQDTYRIGDVVAYRSSDLDAIVLHRIAGMQGDRYLFKGDQTRGSTPHDRPRPSSSARWSGTWRGRGRRSPTRGRHSARPRSSGSARSSSSGGGVGCAVAASGTSVDGLPAAGTARTDGPARRRPGGRARGRLREPDRAHRRPRVPPLGGRGAPHVPVHARNLGARSTRPGPPVWLPRSPTSTAGAER